jgi:Flp pilus assembly protein CpaB
MGVGRGRRTGMVLIFIIIIVLVVVLGGAYLLFTIMNPPPPPGDSSGESPTGDVTVTPPPTTVDVIVASRDIPRGTRLSVPNDNPTLDVTTIAWPDTIGRPTGALEVSLATDAPGLVELIDGRIARVDILAGQPVLDHMLTPGDEPTELGQTGSDAALLIPTGQVAIAFPLNRVSGVAYALRAGDHVDILASLRMVDVDEDFQTILPNNVGTVTPTDESGLTITKFGREEAGPFGISVMVVPSEDVQRPRQVTQLLIDNAAILRVGSFPLGDIDQPIVVTQAPPQPTPVEGAAPVEGEATPTPVPVIITVPDIITLVMSRQDALVLKYALETGADIDFALRSAVDNDVSDVTTDSVTLQYIIDFYNVAIPPRLPVASQPRIDLMAEQTGIFTPVQPASETPPPAPAPAE